MFILAMAQVPAMYSLAVELQGGVPVPRANVHLLLESQLALDAKKRLCFSRGRRSPCPAPASMMRSGDHAHLKGGVELTGRLTRPSANLRMRGTRSCGR